ncbi:hypothetical protein T07_8947 [Trichinella nelsoni]|uniref:Reverse transcriptase RNase H-like domain-containing protein n=1 Tax=Trichinella nelsoni TaxID=6336 RepID=A0A0V0SFU4_9BILA|nr:hypothetical protein T07_8947 [Trichinella nelsoni]
MGKTVENHYGQGMKRVPVKNMRSATGGDVPIIDRAGIILPENMQILVLLYIDSRKMMLTRTDQSLLSLPTEIKSRQRYKRWRVWYTPETQCGWKIKGNNVWQLDNKAEHCYCATKREMLNLFWALREFYPHLYGGLFLVRADHSWLLTLEIVKSQRDGTHDG